MTQLPDKFFFRPREVAALLEESVRNVQYWIQLGRIKTVKHGRKRKVTREEMQRLMEAKSL